MTYVVLARKWRPMLFEDVVGQEHVTRTLMNALKNGRVAHAYIFAGPRGVGKTTTARLLAKAVNCAQQPAVNPCNQCQSCRSITEGTSMDVIEIDGASNRGIDEIRNLRENIKFAPAASRYKIYIIDEVHMLTKEAFNALLKTLEEPPAHAIFIFATTEIHRVPLTILSRCQRFDFKRIPVQHIRQQLRRIMDAEKIEVDDDALLLVARKADGSMRDAESILDQMISFSEGKITAELVRRSLGLIDEEMFFEFTDLMEQKEAGNILKYANKILASGHDVMDFVNGLQEHFRNLLIARSLQDTRMLDVSDYYREKYMADAQKYREEDLIHIISIIGDAGQKLKYSVFPQLTLELLLLKLAFKPPQIDLEEILALLEKLKNTPPAPSSPSPAGGDTGQRKQPEAYRKTSAAPTGTVREATSAAAPLENKLDKIKQKLSGLKNPVEYQPAEPPEAEATAPAISIEQVKQRWPEIVAAVKKEKIALGSFLQEGLPYRMENGRLMIAYDKSAAFHREHVERNKKAVEESIHNVLGNPLKIGFLTVDFKSEGIKQQPRTPEEILADIKTKEPIIQKIIDTFGLVE